MLKRSISGIILVAFMLFMIDFSSETYLALWALFAFMTLAEFGSLSVKHGSKLGKRSSLISLFGALYILLAYAVLAFGFDSTREFDRMLVITFISLIWVNDVGAYLVGSAIGKHKMAPKISPKKSWEGFFGGFLLAIVGGILWYVIFWSKIEGHPALLWERNFNTLLFAGLGAVVAVGAVLGDLVESKYKRMIGVKDSGKIIPGHGGMLDRFDALLLAAPLAYVYLLIMLDN